MQHTFSAESTICINTIRGLETLPLEVLPDGTLQLIFTAAPGLYQFSVIADARDFDWNELYFELHDFGNTGQRTGPWDFNLLDKNKPLVPSYWFSVNEEEIGLWFFQRVSVEDVEARRFRGRAAFRVCHAGEVRLRFKPYRPMQLYWMSATLENDPEDNLLPAPPLKVSAARPAAAEWNTQTFWDKQRERLATTHRAYHEPLARAFRWVQRKAALDVSDLPLLITAVELGGCGALNERVLPTLDAAIALPHWGNPNPEGYSHDGDMGAAFSLKWLAWAYHAFHDRLGREREDALLAKLRLQGERFLNLALLNRDYWGGSILQDHGRISLSAFGCAALHLADVLPEAGEWLKYVVPRLQRSTAAMPRDGVIPQSSYCNLPAYMDEMTQYRDALLAHGGEDVFDQGPFLPMLDYLIKVVRPCEHTMIVAGNQGDRMPYSGGNAFLNRMASKFGDGRAALLQELLLRRPEYSFHHSTFENAYYHGALWGFFSYDPEIQPVAALPPMLPLQHFPDSGFIHYQERSRDVVLSARCGPWLGYHSERHAKGPCDRMGLAPGAGHFIVAVDGQPLLCSPDYGYSLHSGLCTCLLIDGQGQCGDIGYPMSIPSKLYRGEEFVTARWDESARRGFIRFNLQPAYPDELGVIFYARDLLLEEGGSIICRDRILLQEPKILSWLFQSGQAAGIAMESATKARFGHTPGLELEARPLNIEILASVRDTDVVWSYSSASGYEPFKHLRFDSEIPVCAATVDFLLTA